MAGPAMARIDEAGVAAVRVGEGAAEPVLVRWHDDEVDVVWHQAIGPDLRTRALSRLAEQVEVELVVAVLEEGLLPAIAALGDVVGIAGKHEAGEACHCEGVTYLVYLVNCHRNSQAKSNIASAACWVANSCISKLSP